MADTLEQKLPDSDVSSERTFITAQCTNCAILLEEITSLKSQLAAKDSEIKETHAKLLKTEKQLKRSTEISDKLLLKIQKFSALKQIKNANNCNTNSGENQSADKREVNPWNHKPTDEFGMEKSKKPVQNEVKQTSSTLADEIKSVAQSVCDQQGYIYDQKTGMYYDYNSGYYYDNERSLFFDPASGTYFYYDADSREYKFHSQIDVTSLYIKPNRQRRQRSCDKQSSSRRSRSSRKETEVVEDEHESRKRRKHRTKSEDKKKRCRETKRKRRTDSVSDGDQRKRTRKCRSRRKNTKKRPATPQEPPPVGELVIDEDAFMEAETINENGFNRECEQSEEQVIAGSDNDDREEGELTDGLSTVSDDSLPTPSSLSDSVSTDDSGSDSESCDESNSEAEEPKKSKADEWEDYCTQTYAPCVRAMVLASSVLGVGSLHVITTSGGTIGRESGLDHVIVIPDPMISKVHCEIVYNSELKRYTITDHASQNGTVLNGHRIGEAKVKSQPKVLHHCDELELGGTKLCLHIHPGRETCESCEPGQVQARLLAECSLTTEAPTSREDRETARRKQLKNIRRKFGLEKEPYTEAGLTLAAGYSDKSSERRRHKGSDNPYQKDDPAASVHRAITSDNKGHKLLARMGWTEGQSLGKGQDGIKEPIIVDIRTPGSGLGSLAVASSLDSSPQSRLQLERKLKTQIRFAQLDKARTSDEKPACFIRAEDDDDAGLS